MQNVTDYVETLQEENVLIFSSGIGQPPTGWMDSEEKEQRVKDVAKDVLHYACVETWVDILNHTLSSKMSQH